MILQYIQSILPYAHFIALMLTVYALYSYMWHMYSGDKSGTTDYENLANLALDDNLDSHLIQSSVKNYKNK